MVGGGPLALLFATTFPERVAALILVNTSPRSSAAPDFPWGVPDEVLQKIFEVFQEEWGTGIGLEVVAPSMADDRRFRRWWAAYQRAAATTGAVTEAVRMSQDVDVRHVLPHVRTPTLILHQKGDLFFPVECAHYMAQQIPGARYVELPGPDHLYWLSNQDRLLTAVKQFVTRIPEGKSLRTRRQHRNRSRTGWEALTDAELDVVRLVAEGLTNREIARRLHVSPRTVQTHVAHAFGKLGLARRSELAVEASQHLG